jgi:hypothetical protein
MPTCRQRNLPSKRDQSKFQVPNRKDSGMMHVILLNRIRLFEGGPLDHQSSQGLKILIKEFVRHHAVIDGVLMRKVFISHARQDKELADLIQTLIETGRKRDCERQPIHETCRFRWFSSIIPNPAPRPDLSARVGRWVSSGRGVPGRKSSRSRQMMSLWWHSICTDSQ